MRYVRFAFLIPLLLFASRAMAINWYQLSHFCSFESVEIPPIPDLPVPVGCEIIDCCPGCPGPGPINWRINVDKTLTSSVTLRFEGLDTRGLSALKISGSARREGAQIVAGPGESLISGFPAQSAGHVPVAFVTPRLNSEKLRSITAGKFATQNELDGGVEIIQYLGKYIVNRYRSRYTAIWCNPPVGPATVEDQIRLTSNTSNDNAVIMADYRTALGGCENDLIHRTATIVGIGNALSNGTCNSEVSVFSDDNAMSFEPNVTTWTDPAGDLHTANLQPIINAPVAIWIANGAAAVNAANDMANANLLYNQNNVGVQFTPTFNNVSGNPAAVAAIDGTLGDCGSAAAISGTAWYNANRLNIYYVNGAFTGVNCGADRNVSYIGTIANIASLPHEIGHAYGLRPSAAGGHTNGLAGFGNNNIMWGGGPATRDNFAVGQAFRINVYNLSQLNVNGNRAGATRNCPPLTADNLCPALALDSLPH